MRVRYIGSESVGILRGKEYEVLSVEKGWFRVMTELDDSYLFPPEVFELLEESSGGFRFDDYWFYPGFVWPKDVERLLKSEVDPPGWELLPCDRFHRIMQGMMRRYPQRKLVPFAVRMCNDDTACCEVGKGETIQIIHDFASPGWEQRREYANVQAWLKAEAKPEE